MENEVKVEKMTLGEKIKKFFVKPSELFAQYKEEPKYGKLFLIIGIVTFVITIINSITAKNLVNQQIIESTQGQNPQATQVALNIANSPVLGFIGAIFAVIGVYITIYIASFIYYLLVKLFKGNIKYNQMVSIYSLSYFTMLIYSVIRLLYSLIFPNSQAVSATITDILIQSLNIFGIWQMVLLVFGISKVAEISKKKSIIIVVIVWVLALGFSILMFSAANALKGFTPSV